MASLALHDIDPELLDQLAKLAKRLGTTIEREALRALREHLAEPAQRSAAAPPAEPEEAGPGDEPSASDALPADPRFVREHGIWVFTGTIDPHLIPDHRELREERIDSFVKAALGESSD